MPIMKPTPSTPPAVDPIPVQVTDKPYRGASVDSRYEPEAFLLTYVEGSNWRTEYYSQVLGADSDPRPQDTSLAPAYQQYRLIKGLEVKVTSPLTTSQDTTSADMIVSGQATTYPHFIPNEGDMFLADIGDGREGIFAISAVEKKSYLSEAVYQINYVLVDYSQDASLRLDDLTRKTIDTAYFKKEFLVYGQNPVVESADYANFQSLDRCFRFLMSLFMRDAFSVEHQTLIVPGQTSVTYDPFLTRAFLNLASTDDHPNVSKIRLPAVAGDQAMGGETLWDAILAMDANLVVTAMQKMALLDTVYFRALPQYSGIYYTGINWVVYPTEKRTDVDQLYTQPSPAEAATGALTFGGRRYTSFQRLAAQVDLGGFKETVEEGQSLPDIVKVISDPYYVLTAGFYEMDGATPASNLEVVLKDALNGQPIDVPRLLNIASQAQQWENLERFYYIPILLALIKTASRSN